MGFFKTYSHDWQSTKIPVLFQCLKLCEASSQRCDLVVVENLAIRCPNMYVVCQRSSSTDCYVSAKITGKGYVYSVIVHPSFSLTRSNVLRFSSTFIHVYCVYLVIS